MGADEAIREIIENLMELPEIRPEDVSRIKLQAAAKHRLSRIPSNPEIIAAMKLEERQKLLSVLRRKATRTISGVTVVAVMTQPNPCPQPEPCAYCPGGPAHGVPQSYTGFEPATMRGLQHNFDPYLQVKARIEQLETIGHLVDKIELIIMGGTFPAAPLEYQTWFIKRCLDAITGFESENLEEAKRLAETSRIRNVGITVETRPDWAKERHVDLLLSMGATRVELGVQNPDDKIYQLIGRKHTVKDVVEATRILKDAGVKVAYHMMPGLPGSNWEKDLEAFQMIFNNTEYRPDMIKIYPCLVLKGTKVYEWYLQGKYRPYTTEEAAELIAEVKRIIPPWVRIMRVQRDIPAPLIVAGVNRSNLRQLVQQKLKAKGLRCRCIRCREVGHRLMADGVKPNPEKVKILTTSYAASEGEEIFISAEDLENDVLIGYLRLRIPSEKAHRLEIKQQPCGIIRELHVYGPVVPVGKRLQKVWQHKGCGSILLAEAERITCQEYGFKKILVISALGTKQYYKRFGYMYEGPYMSKLLKA
ncbi:MAG: tRNA uridine(34) 5-carboxymethylaminomethyl modification radical SAM/GNAT enzyme Elp3 [Candidatus Bathyarchaeota archaeon]|nr:tRNA uridine(34) 5-carboxymethylaminomethyl modification radical SAM/GNAT enzyme Elp3 [Candidatus Bathyarchaeota archaeon]MCX8177023.1 tRNA uridine(34) 5-carboxymethylaminomethyl modification radical SAM/GNAT enzyme Elp3 [Candidatus Bathyarchaeota archaeon]MDW8194238.1 tRNA uridine(34) 5-carboxymethylaminomethyl modification radical SAM/GNAT enzyme Elp3 [Nitrososphaerota archaeon]